MTWSPDESPRRRDTGRPRRSSRFEPPVPVEDDGEDIFFDTGAWTTFRLPAVTDDQLSGSFLTDISAVPTGRLPSISELQTNRLVLPSKDAAVERSTKTNKLRRVERGDATAKLKHPHIERGETTAKVKHPRVERGETAAQPRPAQAPELLTSLEGAEIAEAPQIPETSAISELSAVLELPQFPELPELPEFPKIADEADIEDLPTWVLPAIRLDEIEEPLAQTKPQAAISRGFEGYFALIGTLLKSSGVYALASLATPLISLVMAPFVTHYVSQSDYGALAVISTAISLFGGISQLGLGSAFFRAYNYDFTSESERRSVLATASALLVVLSLIATTGVAVLAPMISSVLLGTPDRSGLILIGVSVLLLQNLTVPAFAWMRAENRPAFFALLSVGSLLVNLVCTILFVGPFNLGIGGSLLGTAASYLLVVLCTAVPILIRSQLRIRVDIARSMLAFGVPQVFSLVSFWILQFSDRLLLSLLRSQSQTASYAVAYNLGTVLSTVVISPFTLAWPTTMYAIAKREDGPRVFGQVFRWFGIVLFVAAFGLSVVGRFALDLLFPPSYHTVGFIVPIIAASIAFYGVYLFFMTGVSLQRKTWLASLFMTIAAVLNVGLNLILIPLYGASGAALSTLIAYIILAIVAYIGNQRLYHVPYQIGFMVNIVIMGVGLYLISYEAPTVWGNVWQWPAAVLALLVFGGWVLVSGQWFTSQAKRRSDRSARQVAASAPILERTAR